MSRLALKANQKSVTDPHQLVSCSDLAVEGIKVYFPPHFVRSCCHCEKTGTVNEE